MQTFFKLNNNVDVLAGYSLILHKALTTKASIPVRSVQAGASIPNAKKNSKNKVYRFLNYNKLFKIILIKVNLTKPKVQTMSFKNISLTQTKTYDQLKYLMLYKNRFMAIFTPHARISYKIYR